MLRSRHPSVSRGRAFHGWACSATPMTTARAGAGDSGRPRYPGQQAACGEVAGPASAWESPLQGRSRSSCGGCTDTHRRRDTDQLHSACRRALRSRVRSSRGAQHEHRAQDCRAARRKKSHGRIARYSNDNESRCLPLSSHSRFPLPCSRRRGGKGDKEGARKGIVQKPCPTWHRTTCRDARAGVGRLDGSGGLALHVQPLPKATAVPLAHTSDVHAVVIAGQSGSAAEGAPDSLVGPGTYQFIPRSSRTLEVRRRGGLRRLHVQSRQVRHQGTAALQAGGQVGCGPAGRLQLPALGESLLRERVAIPGFEVPEVPEVPDRE